MAEVTETQVFFEQQAVNREQALLYGKYERGERTSDEYLQQWKAAEQWARRFIVGQQMFELFRDELIIE